MTMAEKEPEAAICARPECDHPGPSLCASCRLVGYCGRTCQVEDWPRHKEECQGHLRKIGMKNLEKADGYRRDLNWMQALRYSDLALVKLKQLTDRPIEDIDAALNCKFDDLNYMNQIREALECAKECYCLYLTSHTHPPAICASFDLIESCIHNEEFEDAELYARTTWETITLSRDSHIPDNQLQWFTAQGAYCLAWAMLNLAQSRDVSPEDNQAVAQEAIGLARRALEIYTPLQNEEEVASATGLLAQVLDYFNNGGDDEALRLYKQAIILFARQQGTLSVNVAAYSYNLGGLYYERARRAHVANDLDREMAKLGSALPLYREAARIYRAINYSKVADDAVNYAVKVEEDLRQCTIAKAAAVATAGTAAARG